MEQENKISTTVSQKNLDLLSYFKDNANFVFVYKKTEKLATAMYMVTNLFSDNEPMKWSLRKKVGELLSFSLDYKDTFASRDLDFATATQTKVLELTSLLEVAMRSGLISQMNFSILKQEFFNLIVAFDKPKTPLKQTQNELLTSAFFDIHEETQTTPHTLTNESKKPPFQRVQPAKLTDKKYTESATEEHILKRSNRQNAILNLVKRKGEVSIKDISEIIKDCSEKTIQRELNSFISLGLVKRAGERRWSKYSLI